MVNDCCELTIACVPITLSVGFYVSFTHHMHGNTKRGVKFTSKFYLQQSKTFFVWETGV